MIQQQLVNRLNQGLAHHKAGRLDKAEAVYRQVRPLAPKHFELWHLSGLLAFQQERMSDAAELLRRALQLKPDAVACEVELALALLGLRRTVDAEKHLRHAVATKPDFQPAWEQLAYCLKTQDRLAEAVTCHERAVALAPKSAESWYNYGLTLSLLGRPKDALACHDRAAAASAEYPLAWFGRAQALHQLNRIAEAVDEYGKFLARVPNHHEARSYRLFALQNLENVSREQVFADHIAYGKAVGAAVRRSWPNQPDPDRKLRVAILSPDFREHSCAYFFEPIVANLDRSQFELCLYHDHFREDAITTRFRGYAAVWRNFVGQPASAVERSILGDAPDVIVDLAGHTGMTSRLPLFARRLAPVQVSYLGYPDTTGVPAMDYRFTDSVADPEGDADRIATERLVRFAPTAWTYTPPANAPVVEPRPVAANGYVTFGCFNALSKITDSALTLWARVLAAVPNSRLLLKGKGLSTDVELRGQFVERLVRAGIPERAVEFLERTDDTRSHLALYSRVDIALDTFPYNGTTTTCESLWMGVPVIALLGDRHLARVSSSLLHAIGHPELVAANADAYVEIAANLALDPARLATLSASLRADLQRSPLLDHAGQAARFGAALRECWRTWCRSS